MGNSSIEAVNPPLQQTNVICCPRRVNVFDAKGKLIGQDYQRDNGEWMHKWIDPKTGTFERGSWRGKCQGEDMRNWSYEDCISEYCRSLRI